MAVVCNNWSQWTMQKNSPIVIGHNFGLNDLLTLSLIVQGTPEWKEKTWEKQFTEESTA